MNIKLNQNWLQENGKYKCPECGKEYSKTGICTHIWRKHTQEGQNFNPNIGYEKGTRVAWNKGLTKETDKRIAKSAQTLSKSARGKKRTCHTEESKKKISEARKKYIKENPDKVPYLLNHSSKKSKAEKLFEQALINNKIEGWVYGYQNSLYTYDFAFPKLKIDIEIDGDTHNLTAVQEKDIRRDNFSIENNWIVIRFTDKQIENNIQQCIEHLYKLLYDRYLDQPLEYNYDGLKQLLQQIENNHKQNLIEQRKQFILNSGIDFSRKGCWVQLQRLCKITHIERWVKKYMPEFYANCYNESNKHNGNKNSHYGSYWITNGIDSKIWKDEFGKFPDGFYKGRVCKKSKKLLTSDC